MSSSSLTPAELTRLLGDWSAHTGTLSQQVAAAISEVILSAAIPTGARLPSQRSLAETLGVARGTVSDAFDLLALSGLVDLNPGARARVRGSATAARTTARLDSFSDRTNLIDLSSGALPGLDEVTTAFQNLDPDSLRSLVRSDGYEPHGLLALREAIAADLSARGTTTAPDDLLITSGAQQAVWLCAQMLTAAGDVAVMEEPTYRGAIEAFGNLGARLIGVPVTSAGVDVDHLIHLVKRMRPRVVYLQPTAHNPTGVTMSLASRRALVAALQDAETTVIEDTSTVDLLFEASAPPTLTRLLHGSTRVLMIGTISKLWWGGLRVGWIKGERGLLRHLAELRKGIDLSGSPVDQLVASRLIPLSGEARAKRRESLAAGRDALLRALRSELPTWTYFTPSGGTGLWVDTHVDSVRLTRVARDLGVRVVPGPSFSVTSGMRTYVRLPFGGSEETIWSAVEALAAAFNAVQRKDA